MTPEKELRAGRSRKKMLLRISFEISERSRRHSFFLNICQPPPKREIRFGHFVPFSRDRCNLTPDWSLFSPFFPLSVTQSICLVSRKGCAFTKSRETPQDEYLLRQTFDEFQTPKTIRLSFPKKNHRRKKKTSPVPPERSLDSLSSSSPFFPWLTWRSQDRERRRVNNDATPDLSNQSFHSGIVSRIMSSAFGMTTSFRSLLGSGRGGGGAINLIWHGGGSLWAEFFKSLFCPCNTGGPQGWWV